MPRELSSQSQARFARHLLEANASGSLVAWGEGPGGDHGDESAAYILEARLGQSTRERSTRANDRVVLTMTWFGASETDIGRDGVNEIILTSEEWRAVSSRAEHIVESHVPPDVED